MKHIKQIEVEAFTDGAGRPTCATNFQTGEVCKFYRTQRFGCHETCIFAEDNGKYSDGMQRRTSLTGVAGDGTLIPLKTCPIWKKV
jgi:hypothetical protein